MLWETARQLADLPPIPFESRRLIGAFINVDQDIENLAAELNEDFFDLVIRLCDPTIKKWIDALNTLKDNERRQRALRALDATLTRSTDPKLIHRAASRLLRHLEHAASSRALRHSCDASTPASSDPPPEVAIKKHQKCTPNPSEPVHSAPVPCPETETANNITDARHPRANAPPTPRQRACCPDTAATRSDTFACQVTLSARPEPSVSTHPPAS